GEEVTTPGGHASVWGLEADEWIDFRVSPKDARIGELVATSRRYGALFSVNHPASECVGCGWTHEFVDGIEAIEISNGRHGEVANAIAIWDRLLRSGRRITGVGSSDWHSAPSPLDDAHVRVLAPALTEDAILGAIRGGHVIVMRSARDGTPDIAVRTGGRTARVGESLEVATGSPLRIEITAPGQSGAQVVVVRNGTRAATATLDLLGEATIEQPAAPGYVRVELYGADGSLIAIANPVYLVRPSP
ncbi:MAG: CehA/McbA family metallohydrolase, partial [Vicinamibacterales bacterium]